jgi:flagellar FliL protein
MSDAKEETSNSKETAAAPAKGSKKMLIIIVVLLLAGGGGGFYFLRIRGAAAASAKTKDKSETKKSSKAAADGDGSAEDSADTKDSKDSKDSKPSEKKLLEMSVPEDAEVKQVVELQPFIVNLADDGEPRYLRMTVSVGLAESGESKPDPLFTTKVRNAMLAILTSKRSDEILTVEGKAKLRKELLHAAEAAVTEPEVHAIYITDFIVQL